MGVIQEIWLQWGLVGVIAAAAVYVIWDNYRQNKKIESQLLKDRGVCVTTPHVSSIMDRFDKITERLVTLENNVDKRLTKIEDCINHKDLDQRDLEKKRLQAVLNFGPLINTIMTNYIGDISADHICIGLLHNGVYGPTGIPFLKFDVVAEKMFPIRNTQDKELIPEYNNVNLTTMDKLPAAIYQNDYVFFDLENENDVNVFEGINDSICRKSMKIGIKKIIFASTSDQHGCINGFVCAYSFDDTFNVDAFMEMRKMIEKLYIDIKY